MGHEKKDLMSGMDRFLLRKNGQTVMELDGSGRFRISTEFFISIYIYSWTYVRTHTHTLTDT